MAIVIVMLMPRAPGLGFCFCWFFSRKIEKIDEMKKRRINLHIAKEKSKNKFKFIKCQEK
jgi:hypothetical protein